MSTRASLKISNDILAFHLRGRKVREIKGITGQKNTKLPKTLVIAPGYYKVFGKIYDLTKEGLYRFFNIGQENQQRIVFQGDILSLISSICWLTSHGSRDDFKGYDEIKNLALKEKLVLTCGPTCNFAHSLFCQLGIQSRPVGVRTLEKPNGYNDGHVLLEVFLKKEWILFDLSAKWLCQHEGKRLSLLGLIPHVKKGDYETEHLSWSTPVAITDFVEKGYDYGLWYETGEGPWEERFRRGYQRVMMMPVIGESGIGYSTLDTEAEQKRAKRFYPNRDIHFLTRTEFLEKFYSKEARRVDVLRK